MNKLTKINNGVRHLATSLIKLQLIIKVTCDTNFKK